MTVHPSGVQIYSLSGEFLRNPVAKDFIDQLDHDLEQGKRKFLLNLKNLKQLDSSGLSILLRFFTKVRNKGGDSSMIHPSVSIRKLLEISKLNTVFRIEESEEAAIQHLTAQEA
jgi:anti-sigma B factor antagonist